MMQTLYTHHHNKLAINKVAIGSYASPNAAPVLRTNMLDVIPRFGHKTSPSGWYHLTVTKFVHVLNNLFDASELQKAETSTNFMGFQHPTTITGWGHGTWTKPFPTGYINGRATALKSIKDALPTFNTLCNNFDTNHCGKYIRMQAKVPLSVVYIATGSILANICGYQKIGKTKIVTADKAANRPGRQSLSIIYNSYDNAFTSPAKLTHSTATDPNRPTSTRTDAGAFYATPYHPQTNPDSDGYLWLFPKIPIIDGKDNNFKAFLFDEKGDDKYDYLYINAQNPVNHLNAGDIFYYTGQDSLVKWRHIGNFQSPLLVQSPAPVYGYGLSNLENDSTKTAEIVEGSIHLEYTTEQLEFKTLTTNELLSFDLDPRNTYGDRVHIPYTIMKFLIKRVK